MSPCILSDAVPQSICFLCVSTEKPLCCLTCFCHIVQFSRCRSPSASFRLSPAQLPTAFAVRFEDPTSQLGLQIQKQISCLVGLSGLEPPTLRLSVVRSSQLSYGPMRRYSLGGDSRDRTGDLLLARQALSQLSYIPVLSVVPPAGVYPLN